MFTSTVHLFLFSFLYQIRDRRHFHTTTPLLGWSSWNRTFILAGCHRHFQPSLVSCQFSG